MSNPGLNPNDPVAQALAQLRKAGANPQVDSVPRGASERKEKKYNKRRITTRWMEEPTAVIGSQSGLGH
ncbi:hypothetical protein MA47_05980 [Corynebacterium auriscanis]|uniref:Uncharacterized protein n=1 Tax=Corynebacterium auriscanis TaxID=99807 RepID=A0A0A2DNU4_9CORY|nr:hypothetical protein [Corynebacterium auriscanis]KGM18546.1 hypothetical protein MA47_05980 [Corynebacterium auriscanis]